MHNHRSCCTASCSCRSRCMPTDAATTIAVQPCCIFHQTHVTCSCNVQHKKKLLIYSTGCFHNNDEENCSTLSALSYSCTGRTCSALYRARSSAYAASEPLMSFFAASNVDKRMPARGWVWRCACCVWCARHVHNTPLLHTFVGQVFQCIGQKAAVQCHHAILLCNSCG